MSSERHFPSLRVRLLGPFDVAQRAPDNSWVSLDKEAWGRGRYARSVFKRLVCAPGRRLSRGLLQEDLWPHIQPRLADQYLYTAINKLRRVLGEDSITTQGPIYALADQSRIQVDFDICEAILRQVENLNLSSPQALSYLEEARRSFERGECLEGEDGLWCYLIRKRAEDALRQCRLWLASAYEGQGKLWQAGEQYRALTCAIPPDEEALHQWMQMLARHGKAREALKCYQDYQSLFERQGFPLSPVVTTLATRLQEHMTPALPLSVQPFQDRMLSKPDGERHVMDISRRNLIQSAIGIAGTTFLSGKEQVREETLPLLAALTTTCRQLSEGNELALAEHILWAYLPKIELLARLSSTSQKETAHLTSQGYLLAASLAGHRDDLLSRLRYSEQALHFGERAGDLNLQVVSMRQIAISFDYLGHPDHALHIYRQTLPRVNEASPLLRACIYADIAGTYTQLDQEKEAKQFLNLAYEHFPAYQENEPDFLSTICRYATLILCEGLYYVSVGQPHKAERVFAKIDGIRPKSSLPERIRIDLLNCQAETFWALRDLEQACFYLETAIQASIALGSERRLKESFSLFQQMQQTWQKEPSFTKLRTLFFATSGEE